MKLTVPSKISALLTSIRKWKIEVYGDYKRFYQIFFIPTISFKDWSADRLRMDDNDEFVKIAHVTEYQLNVAFLTAFATIALKKEEAV